MTKTNCLTYSLSDVILNTEKRTADKRFVLIVIGSIENRHLSEWRFFFMRTVIVKHRMCTVIVTGIRSPLSASDRRSKALGVDEPPTVMAAPASLEAR